MRVVGELLENEELMMRFTKRKENGIGGAARTGGGKRQRK
jgi:hypothetical protein